MSKQEIRAFLWRVLDVGAGLYAALVGGLLVFFALVDVATHGGLSISARAAPEVMSSSDSGFIISWLACSVWCALRSVYHEVGRP